MEQNTENLSSDSLSRDVINLKDAKSVDQLDWNKIVRISGETPPDIEEKCLKLCKEYLSGNWNQQTVQTIAVKRITGGMINQIYFCGIKHSDSNEDIPKEVVIKFYGKSPLSLIDKKSKIRDVVIALMFSQNNMGPKVYGVFDQGQILHFYKHRYFSVEEHNHPLIVNKVMKTLAKIHSLEAPLRKHPNFIYDLMLGFYEEAFTRLPIREEMDEYKCETLKAFEFENEFIWIKNVIEKSNSPVVFTHNDYRSTNLLITEPNDELIVCDFDNSGYGYRGYDFVFLYGEWGRTQLKMTVFENDFSFNEQLLKSLVEIYVSECVRIYGKSYSQNRVNCVEHIVKEIKIFYLFSTLYRVIFMMKNDENSGGFPMNRKLCMEMANMRLINYSIIKNTLINQIIIQS